MQSKAIELSKEYKGFICRSLFKNPDGLHGVKHTERVLVHALTLAELNGLPKEDMDILAFAAIYHDIGRIHDGVCLRHGYKAIYKLTKLSHYQRNQLMRLDDRSMRIAEYIVQLHPLSDGLSDSVIEKIEEDDIRIETDFLLKLFKDADALDRVRMNDLDQSYLRLDESHDLVDSAYDLLQKIS